MSDSPITVMREKLDEQAKLNFTLNMSLSSLNVNLIAETTPAKSNKSFDRTTLQVQKLTAKLDVNGIFQKLEFKLKKLALFNENIAPPNSVEITKNLENLIINTESDRQYLRPLYDSLLSPRSASFLDITVTRALVSNLNKKLGYHSPAKSTRMPSTTSLNSPTDTEHLIDQNPKTKSKSKYVSQVSQQFKSHQKWIVEVNASLNDLDLIVHFKRLELIFEFAYYMGILVDKYYGGSQHQATDSQSASSTLNLIPLIRACDMPLVNIDINRVRMIAPLVNTKKVILKLIFRIKVMVILMANSSNLRHYLSTTCWLVNWHLLTLLVAFTSL